MKLPTQLSFLPLPKQLFRCPGNAPNTECSLLAELRDVHRELAEIKKNDNWNFDISNTIHTITFTFVYIDYDKNFLCQDKDDYDDVLQKQLNNLYRIVDLQIRENELEKQLGLK